MLAMPNPFALKQLLPRLSEFTEKIRDWSSELKMSPHEVRYKHWRQALDSVPVEGAPFDANQIRQSAQAFKRALSTFNRPDFHDNIRENDWKSIRELNAGLNTMATYVEKKGHSSNPFNALQQTSNTIYAELGRRAAMNSVADLSIGYGLNNISQTVRSSDLLVKAARVLEETQSFFPDHARDSLLDTVKKYNTHLQGVLTVGMYQDSEFTPKTLSDQWTGNAIHANRIVETFAPYPAQQPSVSLTSSMQPT